MKKIPLLPLPSLKRYLFSLFVALIFFICLSFPKAVTTSTDLSDNKPIELLANQNQDDLTLAFSSAIDSAKESVLLIVYTLTDPSIINALKKKSQEGISVRVICDAKESPPINAKLGEKVSIIRRFSRGRMHQKILVIDGKKTWIGSANMTTESLRMHGNLITYLDHPEFAQHILKKAETIQVEGHHPHPFLHEEFSIGDQPIEMWFLPDDRAAIPRIKDLIQTAKKTVRVAMFTWTRKDLAEAVMDAAKRGVKAEVVIDSYQGKGTSAKIVNMLQKSHVKVSLSRPGPLLHHKFLYIDNETLVNGSANWTKDAFTKNDDCFIVIHKLNTKQQEQMEAVWDIISKESISVK